MPDTESDHALSSWVPGGRMRSGGAILFFAALLFIVTIGFEWSIGWPPSGAQTTPASFMLDHWDALRRIWTFQMLAGFLFGISALLLMQSSQVEAAWPPAVVIWAAVAIGGVLIAVAFGLTLGSYPPALRSLEQSPELFATARGGIRRLYGLGVQVTGVGYLILLLREGIAADGVVPRSWLLVLLGAVALTITLAAMGLLPPRTIGGMTWFLVPTLLGLAVWRAGRHLRIGPH